MEPVKADSSCDATISQFLMALLSETGADLINPTNQTSHIVSPTDLADRILATRCINPHPSFCSSPPKAHIILSGITRKLFKVTSLNFLHSSFALQHPYSEFAMMICRVLLSCERCHP